MGDLRLFNTRTRTTETFAPRTAHEVGIYVCGLTPSAQAHLGHARSFLFFDLLRRYLMFEGYRVRYVQNVTDIDDRSIARARETGRSYQEIIAGYYAEFKACMAQFGLLPIDDEPYATRYIPQIQEMIRALIERDMAYVVEDGIYYRVGAFARYGALSGRNVDELEAGARIEVGEHKENALDFALWKFAKPDEPFWAFEPYGNGRPGWHIECSAMSRALLDPDGVGFDIHGGGADLIFPHHENEIAQSEPLMAHPPMARYWLHGGLLNFEGRKMSKSLGNFEPLVDLLQRHDAQAIRLTFLTTGYSKVMNFTEDSLAGAYGTLEKLKKAFRSLHPPLNGEAPQRVHHGLATQVASRLSDDMNTSAALADVLAWCKDPKADARDEFVTALWLLGIEPNERWAEVATSTVPQDVVDRLRADLGESLAADTAPDEAVKTVIALRTQARANKNFAESDRLRDVLARAGIAIADSKDGTTWTVAEVK